MSVSTKWKATALQPVMVMAYRDEPVKLSVLRAGKGYVEVVGQDRTLPIGFPLDRVYVFNGKLFKALRRAWVAGNAERLSKTWLSCTKWCENNS